MLRPDIISSMVAGSGTWLIHHLLAERITGYHPNWTLFPLLLPHALFLQNRGQPMVLTFHNYVLDRWMHPFSSWIQRLYYAVILKPSTRMAVKRARTVTAVSHFTAQLVQKDLNVTKPPQVIHNGVDIDTFTPASMAGNRKIFLSVSSSQQIESKGNTR